MKSLKTLAIIAALSTFCPSAVPVLRAAEHDDRTADNYDHAGADNHDDSRTAADDHHDHYAASVHHHDDQARDPAVQGRPDAAGCQRLVNQSWTQAMLKLGCTIRPGKITTSAIAWIPGPRSSVTPPVIPGLVV